MNNKHRPSQPTTRLFSMAQRCAPYLLRDQRRQLTKDFQAILKQEAKQLGIPPHKAVRLWNSVAKQAAKTAIEQGMVFLPYLGIFRLIGGRTSARPRWTWCWHFDPTGQPMHQLIKKLQSKTNSVALLKQLPESLLTEASLLGRLADLPYWRSVVSEVLPDAFSVSQ